MALPVFIVSLRVIYVLAVVGLALYGWNAFWLAIRRLRPLGPPAIGQGMDDWPGVVVQLPIYNEQHVVERLIDACAGLDYPRHRLLIQVLDDSTDGTTALAQRRAAIWRRQGVSVQLLHRSDRIGYKAGALAAALVQTPNDYAYIAIFDADFVPKADFLRRTIPHFLTPQGANLGFVQARWDHLNREYSVLTQCQALALDGHFGVEQPARQVAHYPFGFNGSAGVWQRRCIADPNVGGWQTDTLCEDLDLSYRAQLAGWNAHYVGDVTVPAEIPPQLLGFKRQQFRWAMGSVQTLRKLAGPVWHSRWSLMSRYQALIHLGAYLIHPLLLAFFLVTLPLVLLAAPPYWPLTYLGLCSFGPPFLYAAAQRRLHRDRWLVHWSYLVGLTLLGVGLSLNNSLAVVEAFRGREGTFQRTAKFRVEHTADSWQGSSYVQGLPAAFWAEIGLILYGTVALIAALHGRQWWAIVPLLLYVIGFGLMVAVTLWQAWRTHHSRDEVRPLRMQRSSRG